MSTDLAEISSYSTHCDGCDATYEALLPTGNEGAIDRDGWVFIPWRFTFCPTCRTIDDLVL